MQPATTWDHAVAITRGVYEDAREVRLGADKFMLDGRHTGTGGGNHVVLGGATPADSQFACRASSAVWRPCPRFFTMLKAPMASAKSTRNVESAITTPVASAAISVDTRAPPHPPSALTYRQRTWSSAVNETLASWLVGCAGTSRRSGDHSPGSSWHRRFPRERGTRRGATSAD